MTKKIFLRNLRLALRWKFPRHEIAEILVDYEGFFAAGASEGKTENQICAELGDVKAIAAELGAEMSRQKKGLYGFLPNRFMVSGLLLVLFAGYCIFLLQNANNVWPALISAVLLNAALGILLLWKTPTLEKNENRRFGIVAHAALLFIVAGISVILHSQFDTLQGLGIFRNPETAGPRMWLIIVAGSLLVLALALFSLYRLPRSPFIFLSVIFSAIAAIMFLGSLIWLLYRLSDLSRFQASLWILTGAYGAVMGISMLYNGLLWRIRRRK